VGYALQQRSGREGATCTCLPLHMPVSAHACLCNACPPTKTEQQKQKRTAETIIIFNHYMLLLQENAMKN